MISIQPSTTSPVPQRRVEVLTGLALAVDEPESAAAAAAAVVVRDEHMPLPAGIAARLDEKWKR